jgi:hypothetical protein
MKIDLSPFERRFLRQLLAHDLFGYPVAIAQAKHRHQRCALRQRQQRVERLYHRLLDADDIISKTADKNGRTGGKSAGKIWRGFRKILRIG